MGEAISWVAQGYADEFRHLNSRYESFRDKTKSWEGGERDGHWGTVNVKENEKKGVGR